MKDKKGSIVAIEPATGEILVCVSSPDYNLADFGSVTPEEVLNNLKTDPDKPLFNRATMSIYPPGSTIKMLEAVIGLEEGIVSRYSYITCGGGYQFGNRFFKCDHEHGKVNLVEAIEKSCNTFFYDLILKIGLDRWADYCKKFGLGSKTDVDIMEESGGILPDTEYYDRRYGKNKWTRGNLVSLGIGQGELSTTPLQLAKYTALIANKGRIKKPHFVKGIMTDNKQNLVLLEYGDINIGISARSFDIVREGMYNVVNGAGTATHIKLPDIKIAGKTGTSQNPHGENHAVFIAFAPFDNPQIAIAVVVENVGYGGTYAAPIARDIIKLYLEKSKQEEDYVVTKIEK
jgi:penicillin-binding protein 2